MQTYTSSNTHYTNEVARLTAELADRDQRIAGLEIAIQASEANAAGHEVANRLLRQRLAAAL